MTTVDIYPTCPVCGEETYPTMILFSNGRCANCGTPLPRKSGRKCCYDGCCANYPNCPEGKGDVAEEWSCLKFIGEPIEEKVKT